MFDRVWGDLQETAERSVFHLWQLSPLAMLAGLVAVSFTLYPVKTEDLWFSYLVYFIPPFGKESVVPSMVTIGFHPLFVAGAIAVLDVIGALLVFTNWHLLVRIPVIGPWMHSFGERLRETAEDRKGLKGAGGIFLFFWVMFPLQGSGGVSAALISRVLGMPIAVALGIIAVAAFTSALIIGTAIDQVLQVVDPLFVIAGVALVVSLVAFRYLWNLSHAEEE